MPHISILDSQNGPTIDVVDQDDRQDLQQTSKRQRRLTVDYLPLTSWGEGDTPPSPEIDTEGLPPSVDAALESFKWTVKSSVGETSKNRHQHEEGKYLLPIPNDAKEHIRLNFQYALFLLTTNGRSYFSPIHKPRRAVDIGTGTGIWAVEFAQLYPECEVIGTDLSPVNPDYLPSNCSFKIEDAESEWSFNNNVDFIHGQALATCFRDPSVVIRNAFKALNGGGYLEMQDLLIPMKYAGDEVPTDCSLYQWGNALCEGAIKSGRSWQNVQHYKRYMVEAGFVDVQEKRFFWPMNHWAKGEYYKRVATYYLENMLRGAEGFSMKVLQLQGWSTEKIHELLEKVKDDMRNPNIKAYMTIVYVFGRKPAEE